MTIPVPSEALTAFLMEAKRQTYAAQGDDASVTPLLAGSRQLEFQQGAWLYRDIYFGFAYFVGQETIYHHATPVWAMGYAGGLLIPSATSDVVGQVYGFLQAALRQVAADRPYRGPKLFRAGGFTYTDDTYGTLADFWGVETITNGEQSLYQLRYHGGFLR